MILPVCCETLALSSKGNIYLGSLRTGLERMLGRKREEVTGD